MAKRIANKREVAMAMATRKLVEACEVALTYFEDTRHGREWTESGGKEPEFLRRALAAHEKADAIPWKQKP